jgi:hypothetical protein
MSQGRKGLEAFYYPGSDGLLPSLSTKMYYQSSTNWYAEARYNYEEEETFAMSVGKSWVKEGDWSYAFTPILGLSGGKLQGASFGVNSYLSHKMFSFSSSLQYGICPGQVKANLYSWSELNCQVSEYFYAGITLQQAWAYQTNNEWEPGLQTGICFKGWTFPMYIFRPASNQRYFVLGVCREWKK